MQLQLIVYFVIVLHLLKLSSYTKSKRVNPIDRKLEEKSNRYDCIYLRMVMDGTMTHENSLPYPQILAWPVIGTVSHRKAF